MIDIRAYREFVAELSAQASMETGVSVDAVRLATTESQLINLLKDMEGVVVCGNVPGCEVSLSASSDYWRKRSECLLMVLEKMPVDQQGMKAEADRYAHLQKLMEEIVNLLSDLGQSALCMQATLDESQPIRIEWEYNAYGGFNGLSVTFMLKETSR